VLQKSAEPFGALYRLIFDKWESHFRWPARWSIAQILMRSFFVIVDEKFRNEVTKMFLAAHEEMIERLVQKL
jgi:hypothetical protein